MDSLGGKNEKGNIYGNCSTHTLNSWVQSARICNRSKIRRINRATSSSDVLKGRSAYDVFVENFKAWVHDTDPTATVTSTEKDIAITIAMELTDEQIPKAQPMVDGMLKIKQSGEKELRKYDPNFKAPNLIVLDANAKVIAQEKDGKMILDK